MKRLIMSLLVITLLITGCSTTLEEVSVTPKLNEKIVPEVHAVEETVTAHYVDLQALGQEAFKPYASYFTVELYVDSDEAGNMVANARYTDMVSYYSKIDGRWYCSNPVNELNSNYPVVYWTYDRVPLEKDRMYEELCERGWDSDNIVVATSSDTGGWDFRDCDSGEIISLD